MKYRFLITALFFFLLVPEQGCDPAARHRTLTFFFDGVPAPGTAEQEVSAPGEEKPPEEDALARRERERKEQPERVVVTTHQHPPYAAKMCDSCHNVGKNRTGAPMGFSLREERTRLCAMCHDTMSGEELGKTFEWVHGPVQYGACLECHHPHESSNPYMIRKRPIQVLCLKCHNKERLFKTMIHEEIGETDCTECHDPHGSRMRYMIKG